MKKRMKVVFFCLVLGLFLVSSTCTSTQQPPVKYPQTKKTNHVDDYFGTKVNDPYRWLEDMNAPETKQWITEQKNVTDKYLSQIEFRPQYKARLTELWNYESYTNPRKEGKYNIFSKNDGLQEQSVVYIQTGLEGKPEVLLDPNTFSKDGSVSLARWSTSFSHDYKYLSYGISRGGSDWREFYVMEVKTRKILSDHIQWVKFSNTTWYKDGFFYSRYDEPPKNADKLKIKVQNQKIYYHKLGTPQSEDKLIFQDPQHPQRGYSCWVTDNEKYLLIEVWEGAADYNLYYYKNLEKASPVTPVIDKPLGHFDLVDETEGKFLFLTDHEAPNYKVVLIDPQKTGKEDWKEVIAESKYKLDDVRYTGELFIAAYLKDANSWVSVFSREGKKLYDVQLPGIGTVSWSANRKGDAEIFYSFSSFTVPTTLYYYKIKENKSEVFRKPTVKFDPGQYVTKQVFYESKDKTKVPLFLIHKKGLQLNGANPTLLYAYGGFNSSSTPRFREHYIPLLENGGVYAVACIRGGGEYGEKWHRAGMLEKKQNVFDDFIAAAEYLVRTDYTSPKRLAMLGGSNGGLLVGVVMNQRPDLFKVAIPMVGVMDMLRFHKFTIGWAWVGEYGSSENPDHFKFLYKYSPLHNIKEGINYPATFVTTADHDDRVFPAHSFKYISTLQEKYKGKNPVLIRIETKVGHGAGTATSKQIELLSDMYSFMLYNMDIKPGF